MCIRDSTNQSYLTLLDSVQNTCLHLALGAFRSSPALSLCTEAGLLPLSFRRYTLSVKHAHHYCTQSLFTHVRISASSNQIHPPSHQNQAWKVPEQNPILQPPTNHYFRYSLLVTSTLQMQLWPHKLPGSKWRCTAVNFIVNQIILLDKYNDNSKG